MYFIYTHSTNMSPVNIDGQMVGNYSFEVLLFTSMGVIYNLLFGMLSFNWDLLYTLLFMFSFAMVPLVNWMHVTEVRVQMYGIVLFKEPKFVLQVLLIIMIPVLSRYAYKCYCQVLGEQAKFTSKFS